MIYDLSTDENLAMNTKEEKVYGEGATANFLMMIIGLMIEPMSRVKFDVD